LSPAAGSALDDFPVAYAQLSPNRLAFCGMRFADNYTDRWSDGWIVLSDKAGNIVRQRSFSHLDSGSVKPIALFVNGANSIEMLAGEGLTPLPGEEALVQVLRWVRLDSMLNIVEDKRFRLASGLECIGQAKAFRMAGATYCTTIKMADYTNREYGWTSALLKFDRSLNLVASRAFDAQFYNSPVPVRTCHINEIDGHAASGTLYVHGYARMSADTSTYFLPSTKLLHRLDTNLVLIDTAQIFHVGSNPTLGRDTSMLIDAHLQARDAHRVWVGPTFFFYDFYAQGTSEESVAVSLYNMNTRRHRIRSRVPEVNTIYNRKQWARNRSLAADASGQVYVLASNKWRANDYDTFDNSLVVAKFDTAGRLVWHRFLGPAGAHYSAGSIHCDADGTITVLGAAYKYNTYPGVPKRDLYVVRLDSAGAPLSSFTIPAAAGPVFSVYPNPAASIVHLRSAVPFPANATILVANVSGAQLWRGTAPAGASELSIPTAAWAPGVYTWQLSVPGAAPANGRFVKQ